MPDNSYHNFFHVIDVLQTTNALATATGTMARLDSFERFALLSAALCEADEEEVGKTSPRSRIIEPNAAADKAATGKAAVVARRRREKATKIHAWLQEKCEIDHEEELTEILDVFVDPMYGVNSMARLFALDETDIATILAPLSLSTRRLVKKEWIKARPFK
ncbi:hypothetical protein T484DRAFT_3633420 [Baffinella frigidus]|nr:hypothetical protein T484DRAFT_3633420 [Cryptophyta sp. CCMP2293]